MIYMYIYIIFDHGKQNSQQKNNHEEKEATDDIIHCDTKFASMISILHLHTCFELFCLMIYDAHFEELL